MQWRNMSVYMAPVAFCLLITVTIVSYIDNQVCLCNTITQGYDVEPIRLPGAATVMHICASASQISHMHEQVSLQLCIAPFALTVPTPLHCLAWMMFLCSAAMCKWCFSTCAGFQGGPHPHCSCRLHCRRAGPALCGVSASQHGAGLV